MAEVGKRSLFVVGDDAQTIYGFRGSKVDIILNFEDVYPTTREIILNQNYRSTQQILDLAEKVLTHNPHQKKKELFTQNEDAVDVKYYLARNERDEAEYIAKQLIDLYGDIAKEPTPTTAEYEHDEDDDLVLDTSDEGTSITSGSEYDDPLDKSVSSMFDVYLDTSDFSAKTPYNNYSMESWTIPEINWSRVNELDSVVILYRTHSQSRAIEETFLKYHIPYKLVSGTRFLDRKEIKDVIAMLRFLSNGDDKISLSRFLPLILEGVGPKTLEKMKAYLEDFSYPLAPKHQKQLLSVIESFQNVWKNNKTLIDLTKELIDDSGYSYYLKKQYPNKEEYETRLENIGELYSLMFQFDEIKELPLKERLTQFLIHVSLMSAVDNSEEGNTPKVSLMSLHQSKGLEFETVFLVGVEDGILPHQNSFYEEGGMEEEVRLAYVGVTRAKKNLYLISADSRVQYGQIKANPISRIFRPFLDTYIKRTK
jgi:superfamily I DNA/RNA helicase